MQTFALIFLSSIFFGNSFCEIPRCFENCPANTTYSRCGGGLCESTCRTQVEDGCECTPGCVCQPGNLRDPNTNLCIPEETCPPNIPGQCFDNEQWSEFAGCRKTCYTLNEDLECDPSLPTPGCVCNEGFIRCAVFGWCIPLLSCQSCPPGYAKDLENFHCNFCCDECPENEEYNDCGTSCELSCKNLTYAHHHQACNKMCKSGCFCKPGYVRDDSGKCIPKEWC